MDETAVYISTVYMLQSIVGTRHYRECLVPTIDCNIYMCSVR